MNNLPKTLLRTAALMAVSLGLSVAVQAAANPKAGDRPNPKSSEPHPGDARSAEGKAKADAARDAAHEKASLERYDANRNGKLDPDESAAMQADKDKPTEKKRGKGKKTTS
jgi:hypothetical protein